MSLLRRLEPEQAMRAARLPVDPDTLSGAARIVEDVRVRGEVALREHAERLDGLASGDDLVLDRGAMEKALTTLSDQERSVLASVAGRIERFARAQRDGLTDMEIAVPGGKAGHRWIPVASAGAYVPGGRHPLPSSALMTVIPARVAGVETVWVASPHPAPITIAAAFVAGADGLLRVGGAQAVAALAFGTITAPCDLVVGPGNRWVTAAKKHLYGEIGIDGLAGPSEILVIADAAADPALVAADLLAQAEHDTDAVPMLVTTSRELADQVETALFEQLSDLPTSSTATEAMKNGFCVIVGSMTEATSISDRISPEHLALHVDDPRLGDQLSSYGSLFVGSGSAEAFADYGVGPNHVLPTGGGARHQSGLSVSTFLRSPTWTLLDDPTLLVEDTVLLARLEGLEGHARAARMRVEN